MSENIQTEVMRERILKENIDATAAEVFDAWTDPLRIRTWWGPEGFSTNEVIVEPLEGGRFSVEMVDEEGKTFPMRGKYHRFEVPSRLTFTATVIWDDAGGRPLEANNDIFLVEKEGRTEMTWRWQLIDPAPTAIVAAALLGYEKTVNDSLSRLMGHLVGAKGGA